MDNEIDEALAEKLRQSFTEVGRAFERLSAEVAKLTDALDRANPPAVRGESVCACDDIMQMECDRGLRDSKMLPPGMVCRWEVSEDD